MAMVDDTFDNSWVLITQYNGIDNSSSENSLDMGIGSSTARVRGLVLWTVISIGRCTWNGNFGFNLAAGRGKC
jgi:hypothetical protein